MNIKNFISSFNQIKSYKSIKSRYFKNESRFLLISIFFGSVFGILVFLKVIRINRFIFFSQDMFLLLGNLILFFSFCGVFLGIFIVGLMNLLKLISLKMYAKSLKHMVKVIPAIFLFWFLFGKFLFKGVYYSDIPEFFQNKWIMLNLWIFRLVILFLICWFFTTILFHIYFKLKDIKKSYILYLLIILIPIVFLIFEYQIYKGEKKLNNNYSFSLKHPKSKIILLGIDGMEWKIINSLNKKNLLPNIQWLMENGSYGRLKTINFESTAIWTSLASGVHPKFHNVYKHTQSKMPGMKAYVQFPYYLGLNELVQSYLNKINLHLIKMSITSSQKRRVPALWNILSKKRRKVIILNWLATHPIENIYGTMASPQMYHYLVKEDKSKNDIKQYFYSSDLIRNPMNFLEEIDVRSLNSDQYFSELALSFLRKDLDYNLFMLYLRETDGISHSYWKFMEPEKYFFVEKEKVLKYGDIIEKEYIEKDEFIGKILKKMDEKTCLIICSDHGFGPVLCEYKTSGGHSNFPDGIFIAFGKIFKKNYRIEKINIYDICPSILYILGFPCANDMPGKVIKQAFDTEYADEVKYINTYGKRSVKKIIDKYKLSEEEEERLKSLGYIK